MSGTFYFNLALNQGNRDGRPGAGPVQVKQYTKEPQFQCMSIAYCIVFSVFYSLTSCYRDLIAIYGNKTCIVSASAGGLL